MTNRRAQEISPRSCLVCGEGRVEEVDIQTMAIHDGKPISISVLAERCELCREETIKAKDLKAAKENTHAEP